ncbi:MAG: hypothetical protein K9I34_01990 [Bacteroidales bacterium]|nr:hypothetical protein [Bacteroidales bacterium]
MRYFLLSFLMMMALQGLTQIKAITETGDEVLLNMDGTWVYLVAPEESEITINDKKFKKPEDAGFLVKSKITNCAVWINPKEWTFNKGGSNEDAEYYFEKKDRDLYAMLIPERSQIPLETMKMVAFENAKSAAPDIRIEKEEYRFVNDLKILMLQMSGTIQGIRFTYYSYYYSDESGTNQLITYTSENLFKTYKSEMEDFLNGFVIQ